MPGILALTVTPNKGLLKPKEYVACILRIKTYGISVAIRNQLPLFYVNYTQLKNHMAAKEMFHKRGMEMQHEFMLGDKGKVEYPVSTRSSNLMLELPDLFPQTTKRGAMFIAILS